VAPDISGPDSAAPNPQALPGESWADYRQRMVILQAEAVYRRQRELSEQCEPSKTASDRIRIWERLHQIDLPSNPAHRLVGVIAAQTGLAPDEVRTEQRLRATVSG
jgi:hypothetical protein